MTVAATGVGYTKEEAQTRLRQTTDEFEGLFLKMYMEKSLTMDNSLFGKGAGSEIYNSMYVDALSRSMSGGIGISQMLYDHLKGQL